MLASRLLGTPMAIMFILINNNELTATAVKSTRKTSHHSGIYRVAKMVENPGNT